jgi:hypothetical protein
MAGRTGIASFCISLVRNNQPVEKRMVAQSAIWVRVERPLPGDLFDLETLAGATVARAAERMCPAARSHVFLCSFAFSDPICRGSES